MKTYAAGWALQSPALNFFKKFLRRNPSVQISAIVYPNKTLEDIEGIPVIDFDDLRRIMAPGDIVLDCHRPDPHDSLRPAFVKFFDSESIVTMSVPDFIGSLVAGDHENGLHLPVNGANSQNIRALQAEPAFALARDKFSDLESFEAAKRLDDMVRSSDWDGMLSFDEDETPENVLFEVLASLRRFSLPAHFRVLSSPTTFLNALLKLRVQQPEAAFSVELSDHCSSEMGSGFEFYRRSLAIGHSSTSTDAMDAVLLAGEMNTILEAYEKDGKVSPSVFFMRRSILDYRRFRTLFKSTDYRILLRQPDTSPENLLAAVLL